MFKVSARRPGSTPALVAASRVAPTDRPRPAARALARVFRRWAKAARTTASKRCSSSRSTRGAGRGRRRRTADSTFGGGRNAAGAARQLAGQRPLPGPDLDREVGGGRRDEVHDRARHARIAQKVLAERVTLTARHARTDGGSTDGR